MSPEEFTKLMEDIGRLAAKFDLSLVIDFGLNYAYLRDPGLKQDKINSFARGNTWQAALVTLYNYLLTMEKVL